MTNRVTSTYPGSRLPYPYPISTKNAHMKRVMIIGPPGSGKSTLAQAVGQTLDLPVIHMDRAVHWLPGWIERDMASKTAIVKQIIAQDEWVFEGGHSTTYTQRLARADMLVWLDAPLILRLWRVTRRSLRDLGKTRPDLADGCPERLGDLPEFWGFIIRSSRRSRLRMQALYDTATIPKHHLRSFAEMDRFIAAL